MSHISWSVPEPQVPAGTHPALADMARAAAEAFGLFVSNGRGELARRSQLFVARAPQPALRSLRLVKRMSRLRR